MREEHTKKHEASSYAINEYDILLVFEFKKIFVAEVIIDNFISNLH